MIVRVELTDQQIETLVAVAERYNAAPAIRDKQLPVPGHTWTYAAESQTLARAVDRLSTALRARRLSFRPRTNWVNTP